MYLDRVAMARLQESMTGAHADLASATTEIAGLLEEARAALGTGRLAEAFAPGFGDRCAAVSTDLARAGDGVGRHRGALRAADAIVVAADDAGR